MAETIQIEKYINTDNIQEDRVLDFDDNYENISLISNETEVVNLIKKYKPNKNIDNDTAFNNFMNGINIENSNETNNSDSSSKLMSNNYSDDNEEINIINSNNTSIDMENSNIDDDNDIFSKDVPRDIIYKNENKTIDVDSDIAASMGLSKLKDINHKSEKSEYSEEYEEDEENEINKQYISEDEIENLNENESNELQLTHPNFDSNGELDEDSLSPIHRKLLHDIEDLKIDFDQMYINVKNYENRYKKAQLNINYASEYYHKLNSEFRNEDTASFFRELIIMGARFISSKCDGKNKFLGRRLPNLYGYDTAIKHKSNSLRKDTKKCAVVANKKIPENIFTAINLCRILIFPLFTVYHRNKDSDRHIEPDEDFDQDNSKYKYEFKGDSYYYTS